ncbi:hypothetical protein HDV04_000007 [Boothiomyces sp. JEL0838]|nr:hypothetical protein HDV04_000007 [Boothiomyces sp. JEL0838]
MDKRELRNDNEYQLKSKITIETEMSNRQSIFSQGFQSSTDHDADDEEEYIFSSNGLLLEDYKYLRKKKKEIKSSNSTVSVNIPSETSRLINEYPIQQQNLYLVIQKKSSCFRITVCSMILGCFMFLVTFFAFCCQPLSNFTTGSITVTNRTPEIFEFQIHFDAVNTNLIPISLESTDINVYASLKHYKALMSNELLGHVRHFNQSPIFNAASFTKNATGTISIKPQNTLGKLIYMSTPFLLTVEGRIWYSALFDTIQYQIPICGYYYVVDDGPAQIHSC